MRLDVGCEDELRGDVNVDISVPKHRIDKPFVKADAQHLPFKDETFEEVICFHLIEHVENPYKLLDELLRVAKTRVVITCPYRFSGYAKSPQHKHYFNKSWFRELLEKKNVAFKVWVSIDQERDLLQLPLQLTVKIWKKVKKS